MDNNNPALVVLAAGMGSRYGGLKQIDAVDSEGHIIIDFSIYDAIKAGFRDIVFIIKHEIDIVWYLIVFAAIMLGGFIAQKINEKKVK